MSTSEAVTRGVRVHVECHYSKERSDAKNHEHFFLYTVRITNEGKQTVELLNRHWVITNAHGTVQEVRGPGVVGQHPRLNQGQSFEYTSGCPLDTPFGSMHGSYEMLVTDSGERFEAEIGAFPLRQDEVFN
jgi:ApaG protein